MCAKKSISGNTVTITPKAVTADGQRVTITVTSAVTTNYAAQTATYIVTVNGKPLVSTITTTNHEKITAQDTKGNQVVVPKGFKTAADSGATVQDGIVVEDASRNQFVWIPVSNINGDGTGKIIKNDGSQVEITLGRYDFDVAWTLPDYIVYGTGKSSIVQKASEYSSTTFNNKNSSSVSKYKIGSTPYWKSELCDNIVGDNNANIGKRINTTAKNLKGFIESVRDNHGYFIARYEAGLGSSNKTSFKKNLHPDVGYTQPDAAIKARDFVTSSSGTTVTSDLCNSYAWDTTLVYIEKMIGNGSFAKRESTAKNSEPKTGTSGDEVCKIFDLCGGSYEWTTETELYYTVKANSAWVARGGYWQIEQATCGRMNRDGDYEDSFANIDAAGFRVVLY